MNVGCASKSAGIAIVILSLTAATAGAQQWTPQKRGSDNMELVAHLPLGPRLSVADIDTGLVLACVEPIWQDKTETASRVRGRIEAVLDFATVRGHRSGENPARWKGHLAHLLPARSQIQTTVHLRAMPFDDLPTFMAALRDREGVAARALKFLILTAARTGEVNGAKWDEIDFDKKVWTIPADRMKARKEHRVPLSDMAIELVERAIAIEDERRKGAEQGEASEWLFPSPRRKGPTRPAAIHHALRRACLHPNPAIPLEDLRPHDLRRTAASQMTALGVTRLVVAKILNHVETGVTAIYDRHGYDREKKQALDAWAAHLEGILSGEAKPANVVSLAAAGAPA